MFSQFAGQTSSAYASGILDPRTDGLFDRSYRGTWAHLLARILRRGHRCLMQIGAFFQDRAPANIRYIGSQSVPLASIRGSFDRGTDFDGDFHPTQKFTRLRWRKIATAMLNGVDLPPVELIRVGDIYFVKDGHHRISVARALRHQYIDAIVTEWE